MGLDMHKALEAQAYRMLRDFGATVGLSGGILPVGAVGLSDGGMTDHDMG